MLAPTDYTATDEDVSRSRPHEFYFVYTCTGDVESFQGIDEIVLTTDALLLYEDGKLVARIARGRLCFASRSLMEPFQN